MTFAEYAIYRTAWQLMTDEQRASAQALAADAGKGNTAAAMVLRRMVLRIVTMRGTAGGRRDSGSARTSHVRPSSAAYRRERMQQ